MCVKKRERERDGLYLTDRQNKEGPRQPDRVGRIGVIGVYVLYVGLVMAHEAVCRRLATAVLVPLEAFSQDEHAVLPRHTARPQGSPRLCTHADI